MEWLGDFWAWAWARHHNPLSWYIRPLFILPFCYFAYRRSVAGVVLTVVGVLTSMFWFPAPADADPRAAEFLAMEQAYVTGGWTWTKTAMTLLVPVWFVLLAGAFWRRSWIVGMAVINVGALLKVIWSFYFGGDSAWSIIAPVLVGLLICNGALVYVIRRRRSTSATDVRMPKSLARLFALGFFAPALSFPASAQTATAASLEAWIRSGHEFTWESGEAMPDEVRQVWSQLGSVGVGYGFRTFEARAGTPDAVPSMEYWRVTLEELHTSVMLDEFGGHAAERPTEES